MENETTPTTCHGSTVVSIILATKHGGLRKDAAHVTRGELWMAAAEKNWAIGATVARTGYGAPWRATLEYRD